MTGMKKIERIIQKPVVKRKPQPGYHVPPKTLPAFPDAINAGNKGKRKRWKDYKKKKIYEWDYQHGELEGWNWNGKRHEGAFDPNDGKQLKPPDPTKRPITPTIEEDMKVNELKPPFLTSNGIYCLCWYSVKDDKIVGFEDMPKLTSKKVRKWFSLSDDEPAIHCYIVTAGERQHLEKIVKTEIDLNKYAYYVECHKA